MKVIRVIPIAKGIGRETLSYFTGADVTVGNIVKVPLRNRIISGLIVAVENAEDLKANLKTLDYEIRRVEKVHAEAGLPESFITTCAKIAEISYTTTGSILSAMTPNFLFDGTVIKKLSRIHEMKVAPHVISEKLSIQADDEERFSHYKSLIREDFAKKRSVFLCLPSIQEIETVKEALEKGIEPYTYVLTSQIEAKELKKIWKDIAQNPHSLLIIGTPHFLPVFRDDIGTIIIERENAKGYYLRERPYSDTRLFTELFAESLGARLIVGDALLRTETIWRTKSGDLHEYAPLKFRSLSTAVVSKIDMRVYSEAGGRKFSLLSDEAHHLILENKPKSEHCFIFCARRGLSPSTVCSDCGTTVACSTCGAPTVLHGMTGKDVDTNNFFMCHRCGEKRSAREVCVHCGGWRLKALGVGIDSVEVEIKRLHPESTVFILDKDRIKTHEKAKEIVRKFGETPGSILLGTEMALPYLTFKIQSTIIASLDSFFSIPDFRIGERIMQILIKLRSITTEQFLLQTRNPDAKLLEYGLKGNLLDFYKDEITEREQFLYPPFKTIIKLTLEGTKDRVSGLIAEAKQKFASFTPDVFPAFLSMRKGQVSMNMLIKTDPKKSDPALNEKINSLTQEWSVSVNPESLL
ncbi:MAG: Primosomal protein [Candidatus Parcubacteria bacterium]|jgi:primosomal protein N'